MAILNEKMILGKRYVLELVYSRSLNCYVVRICRRKGYDIATEVLFEERIRIELETDTLDNMLQKFEIWPQNAQ